MLICQVIRDVRFKRGWGSSNGLMLKVPLLNYFPPAPLQTVVLNDSAVISSHVTSIQWIIAVKRLCPSKYKYEGKWERKLEGKWVGKDEVKGEGKGEGESGEGDEGSEG